MEHRSSRLQATASQAWNTWNTTIARGRQVRRSVQRRGRLFLKRLWLSLSLGIVLVIAMPTVATTNELFLAQSPSPKPTVATPSPSPSVEELRKQQLQLDSERSNIDKEQNRLYRQEQSAQRRFGSLQQDIKATSAQIQQNEQKLRQATQRLQALESQLAKAEQRYQARQTATASRLRFLQRQHGSYGWAVLLQSQNLNEFLDRRYQLRLIYQSDRQILATLKADADAIIQQHRAIEAQKNDIALMTQQLLAQKSEFQARAKAEQGLINRLRLDRQALEVAEEQLTQDSNAIAALIQQRLGVYNPNRRIGPSKRLLGYPSDGTITSGFGYRLHPILGYTRFHGGLDFGADYGSPIRAAKAGRVLFAGWYGGYGQTVIVDHGNGITTLYGHASEVYVKDGQTVQQGQVIAGVGSTGLSTGPHLHFEVRISGEPVDPLEYL
ncbi:MAG: peptidoglycan DD-metalloendopeptidase family protein [Synechococcales cyanobacterium M58_A2018_015]|nr:peptidoglycan DD-metalloendopeptidase family protein [Synechococcales cyanobacterium M58_A2018_015]